VVDLFFALPGTSPLFAGGDGSDITGTSQGIPDQVRVDQFGLSGLAL
jgi:hypothetical protein